MRRNVVGNVVVTLIRSTRIENTNRSKILSVSSIEPSPITVNRYECTVLLLLLLLLFLLLLFFACYVASRCEKGRGMKRRGKEKERGKKEKEERKGNGIVALFSSFPPSTPRFFFFFFSSLVRLTFPPSSSPGYSTKKNSKTLFLAREDVTTYRYTRVSLALRRTQGSRKKKKNKNKNKKTRPRRGPLATT